jgi:hypothetical protein
VPKKFSTQPVRAVILHRAVGALGEDDELHTSPEMQGLTAAWMPGDHSLCLIIGGGQSGGEQLEPALTVVVPPESTQRLAQTFARPFSRTAFEWSRNPAPGIVIGLGAPARPPQVYRLVWGGMALVVTSRAESALAAFPGRPYVLQIKIEQGVLGVGPVTHRFCVYLTADEVDDLKVVLKYVPSWFVGE